MRMLSFFLIFLLLVNSFAFSGCKNNTSDTTDPKDSVTYHQPGELIKIRGQMEFKLQEAKLNPFIQMNTKDDTIYSLPHIYFNSNEQSIIHITEETTMLTSIETLNSPNYEVGYIVERNDSDKPTNAPYSMDIEQSRLYPIHPNHAFFIITLEIKNTNNKDLNLEELELMIEWDETNQKKVEFLLAQTIFIDAPGILEPSSSALVRWVTTVPSDVSSVILYIEGRKIAWQNPAF